MGIAWSSREKDLILKIFVKDPGLRIFRWSDFNSLCFKFGHKGFLFKQKLEKGQLNRTGLKQLFKKNDLIFKINDLSCDCHFSSSTFDSFSWRSNWFFCIEIWFWQWSRSWSSSRELASNFRFDFSSSELRHSSCFVIWVISFSRFSTVAFIRVFIISTKKY